MFAPPERPHLYNRFDVLARAAAHVRDQRKEQYPHLVRNETMSPAEAARGIRIATALATYWGTIAKFEAEPSWIEDPARGGAELWERKETLTDMEPRAREIADRDPGNHALAMLADAIEAMRWWEFNHHSARAAVNATIEHRASLAARGAWPPLKLEKAA